MVSFGILNLDRTPVIKTSIFRSREAAVYPYATFPYLISSDTEYDLGIVEMPKN
jgi:hypothetical protein